MMKLGATLLTVTTLFSLPVSGQVSNSGSHAVERGDEVPAGCNIALDIHSGKVVELSGGKMLLQPRPAGSILKLFTTYALISSGQSSAEVYYCPASSPETPSTESCWFKPGHGNMTLTTALSNSCNAYFRQWLDGKDLQPILDYYRSSGLLASSSTHPNFPASAFAGLTSDILVRPVDVAMTAASLFNDGTVFTLSLSDGSARSLPIRRIAVDADAMTIVRKGLLATLSEGTGITLAQAAGIAQCYVKTGTTGHWVVDHDQGREDRSQTDGWCLVLYPAESPRYLLLTIMPGSTGAGEASQVAARILQQIIEAAQK